MIMGVEEVAMEVDLARCIFLDALSSQCEADCISVHLNYH